MAYCTPQDVRDLAPQVAIDNTSKPTTAQVDRMIADVERDLDAVLVHLGYVVPLTAPISVAIAKDKIAHAVLARVLRGRAFGSSDPGSVGADAAQAVYDRWIKALASATDPMELPDAERTGEAPEKTASLRHGTAAGFDEAAEAPVSLGMTF